MSAMTAAEAKTKWCPLVRVQYYAPSDDQNAAINRLDGNTHCIGSACMAWRWSRAKETAAYLEAVQSRMKTSGENFNVATQKVYAEIGTTFEHTEGFCGAFGEPK